MESLTRANLEFARNYPGESGLRQPVQVLYGGAHLFKYDSARRMGAQAQKALTDYAPDPATLALALGIPNHLADAVYARVVEKLRREPIEDLRLDFEDGFGPRPGAEEDAVAQSAAAQLAQGFIEKTLPPFIGIRVKPLDEDSKGRSLRTLELFLTTLLEKTGGLLPDNFTVTLPKITVVEQVHALAEALERLGVTRMELMIETPQSAFLIPRLIAEAHGRCVGLHFGAYDYTANLGMTSANQHLLHPACDFARNMMQALAAGTGVALSDGATNLMPVPAHRGEWLPGLETAENRAAVHRAWKLHARHIRHALNHAFYQGWDLHPAQLPVRYAAVYAFFLEGLGAASERLKNFIEKSAQATMVGGVFDDAATGQGLLNYFLRAINCGAIPESDVPSLTGLTVAELRVASFAKILEARRVAV